MQFSIARGTHPFVNCGPGPSSIERCPTLLGRGAAQAVPLAPGVTVLSSSFSTSSERRGQRGVACRANCDKQDVVLSSGFLAFAQHSGFLQCTEEMGLVVGGVMGTSAGALAGSLYCAGYTPKQVASELSRVPPIQLLRPSLRPWRGGVLSLEAVVERLQQLLPPTFEDLQREFAVAVVTADGQHKLIDSGPLAEAVAASAAIPLMFESISIPGQERHNPMKDGGLVDRVGVKAWRDRRRAQASGCNGPVRLPTCLVHVIHRSSPWSGVDDTRSTGEHGLVVVTSPKARSNFFSLGDFDCHFTAASNRARPYLEQFKREHLKLQMQMQQQQQQSQQIPAAPPPHQLPHRLTGPSPRQSQSPERSRLAAPV